MNIVLFDTYLSGHHSEYISHLVDYLIENETSDSYYFVVHPDFTTKFEHIIIKSKKTNAIKWHPVTRDEINTLNDLSIVKKSFRLYNLAEKYATALNSELVYLLYFNDFQLAIALRRPKFKIRGILFQQFSRMSKDTFKEKLKYYRKYYTTKLYLKNSKIESLFVLNDSQTVSYFNSEFKTNVYKVLPDPILNSEPLKGCDIYQEYKISNNKQIFLHFGALADRKGTFEVINSVRFIPKELQSHIAILLVGTAGSISETEKITQCISLAKETSNVEIIWDNNFVSNQMMKSLFLQCKAVLMPYKNAEASSGILGHAIAAKKPVVITGKGLLKELVQNNDFGILLSEISPKSIAESMINIKSNRQDETKYEKYIEEHTSEKFSEILIG